jgi:hypothetical protein
VFLDEGVTVPISLINSLRREVLEKLEFNKLLAIDLRRAVFKDVTVNLYETTGNISKKKSNKLILPKVALMFFGTTGRNLEHYLKNVDRIYVPVWDLFKADETLNQIKLMKDGAMIFLYGYPHERILGKTEVGL